MRKRDKDYYCSVKEQREAFWHKQGNSSTSFKYWHLIVTLHNDYEDSFQALESLEALEGYVGVIPHYDDFSEEALALQTICSVKEADRPLVINSKLKRSADGWEVDLWVTKEIINWDLLNKIRV